MCYDLQMAYYDTNFPNEQEALIILSEPLLKYASSFRTEEDELEARVDAELLGTLEDQVCSVIGSVTLMKQFTDLYALPLSGLVMDTRVAPDYSFAVEPFTERRRTQCEKLFSLGAKIGSATVALSNPIDLICEQSLEEIVCFGKLLTSPKNLEELATAAHPRKKMIINDLASTWTKPEGVNVDRKFTRAVSHGFSAGELMARFALPQEGTAA
jgi:hypothetical protein